MPSWGQVGAISPGTPPPGLREGWRDAAGGAQHPQPWQCPPERGRADALQPQGDALLGKV